MATAKRATKKSTTKKTTAKKVKDKDSKQTLSMEISFAIMAVVSVFLAIFVYTTATGTLGHLIKNGLLFLFGSLVYVLPVALFGLGLYLIIKREYPKFWLKTVYALLLFLCIGALISFVVVPAPITLEAAHDITLDAFNGGMLGAVLAVGLNKTVGVAVSVIILVLIVLILSSLTTGVSLINVVISFFKGFASEVKDVKKSDKSDAGRRTAKKIKSTFGVLKTDNYDFDISTDDEDLNSMPDEDVPLPDVHISSFADDMQERVYTPAELDIHTDDKAKPRDEQQSPNIDECETTESLPANGDTDSAVASGDTNTLEIEEKPEPYVYIPPPVSLLTMHGEKTIDSREEIREKSLKLLETLRSFGVEVKLLQVSKGPAVTRYELQPSPGVKVSKIVSLTDDIALNLAAKGIRIEAPIPGKAAIGIEVANDEIASVALRELIESPEFEKATSSLSVAFGKDIAGKPVIGDISKMPHVLIAGATGSGKSVCINTLITSILYKSSPEDVKLIMVDPKVVELGVYNGIPHLLVPVVTDPKKAAGALNWAVQEMMRRYSLFSDEKVRDLNGYNKSMEQQGFPKLPKIVIIIDELADLMMVAPNEVEDSICRLAQLARAAGMHLVIATQRPSVDVITGLIKANIPSRISFAVSSQIDSRTILDMAGAEKLLGRGDMLYHPSGASKPTRVQGAFVSDKEIESIVDFIKGNHQDVVYDDEIEHQMEVGQTSTSGYDETDNDDDELLPQAIDIALELGQISTSMIQRRLRVGYSRAGRIVDQMEARGIISGADGSKPRQVLKSRAALEGWNVDDDEEG